MMRWFRKSTPLAVEFCERCSQVCDAACRSRVVRERALAQVLRSGGRLA